MNLRAIGALSLLAVLTACEAKQLFIAHDTVIGVHAAVNQAKQSGRLVIGYDREFVTVIPRSVDKEGGGGKEAMSALACTDMEVRGIYLTRYVERTATGTAAKNFADAIKGEKTENVGREFFSCFTAD